jgi:xylulokinase
MGHLLGIDLGTSSVKAVLIDRGGRHVRSAAREYPIVARRPGWAEQDPRDWWRAAVEAVREAAQGSRHTIRAVGPAGQMHGTVLIGGGDQAVRRAVIWPDGRSAAEAEELAAAVGEERLFRIAGTVPFTGFMGPTLLWLARSEPECLEAAEAVLLPKDYLRLRLTGEIATEPTDACSSALFDIRRRRWSEEVIRRAGLPFSVFPKVIGSADVAGTLRAEAALEMGLPAGLPVVAGCGDQVAQALASGVVDPGSASVTVGSGGQLFVPVAEPPDVPERNLHVFCHAPEDRWYLLGAMLTAGLSLRWLRDLFAADGRGDAFAELSGLAEKAPPGAGGLFFLPYLAGERSPLMDPEARGCFVGLTLSHDRGHLTRAVMEGVAFCLRQIVESVESLGVGLGELLASGNGLADPFWRRLTAAVLGRPLVVSGRREQTGVGAALLAGLGSGVYSGYKELADVTGAGAGAEGRSEPHEMETYDRLYSVFREIYPRLAPLFRRMKGG